MATEIITATLESTAYKNNGFVIGKFRDVSDDFSGGSLFSAKGNMIRPELGMRYKLEGFWEQNPKFGPTLVWKSYEIVKPDTDESVIRYLKSLLKNILSDTIIIRIVEAYKKDAIEMIKTRPDAVVLQGLVQGAKIDKMKLASAKLVEFEEVETTLLELNKRLNVKGLPKNIAMKIYERWGSEALSIIDENPYALTRIKGIGFLRADSIALGMNFDIDSKYRKKSAILHVLNSNESDNGCTILEDFLLINIVTDLISDIKTGLEESILDLKNAGDIVLANKRYYQLEKTDQDEKRIAYKLMRLLL